MGESFSRAFFLCIPIAEWCQENLPHRECLRSQPFGVPLPPSDLDKRLSRFLKKTRGEMSFAQFSKVTGLTPSTLFRLEQCDQTITLRRLEPVLKRLKVTLWDVFGDGKK